MRKHGCSLKRQGGSHAIWESSRSGRSAAVPRHQILKRTTCRRICKDLEIDQPDGF
ncbi:MAG: type II toxin-antitoxin system HicA family toxin [Armatimonadota bacterium]